MLAIKISSLKELTHLLEAGQGFFVKETHGGSVRFIQLNQETKKVHIYALDIDIAADYPLDKLKEGVTESSSTFEAAKSGTLVKLISPSPTISFDVELIKKRIGMPVLLS